MNFGERHFFGVEFQMAPNGCMWGLLGLWSFSLGLRLLLVENSSILYRSNTHVLGHYMLLHQSPIPSNSNKDIAFGYGFKSPPATNHSGVVALKKNQQ